MGSAQVIILDTSAVVYATVDSVKLSTRGVQAIEQADRIFISSISIWEIGWKVNQRKLELPLSVQELVTRLKEIQRVKILPVTEETWLKNVELAWTHKDPADRTIVAAALLLNCPLVSNDARIQEFYPQTLW
jgi:PIN domain nuclease of toxin-antitoxin system